MLKRNITIYYLTQFFHSIIFTAPIWIVYYQGKITTPQISLLVTIQYLSQMILELPSGALADLLGRKRTNQFGFMIGAMASLLFPFASAFWHFLIYALLIGLMDSFRSGSEEALLYDTFKQTKSENKFAKVYANGNLIYQIGLIVGSASGGLLFDLSHALPYFLYGLSLAIGAILVGLYIEPKIDSEKFSLKNYYLQIKQGSREAFKNKYTSYLSLFYIFVGGITWSSTLFFNDVMMVELGFSNSLRGILFAVMRLFNVILIGALLKNQKIFNFNRTILFFPIVMIFAFLPGVFLNGYWGLPFVQAAMIGTTARWIILSPLTNEVFSSKYRATAISLLSLLIGFVYVGLTSISGYVITVWGIKTMFSLMGCLAIAVVVPLSIKLLKHKKSEFEVEIADIERAALAQAKDELDPI